jgi:hypothetical protein
MKNLSKNLWQSIDVDLTNKMAARIFESREAPIAALHVIS